MWGDGQRWVRDKQVKEEQKGMGRETDLGQDRHTWGDVDRHGGDCTNKGEEQIKVGRDQTDRREERPTDMG